MKSTTPVLLLCAFTLCGCASKKEQTAAPTGAVLNVQDEDLTKYLVGTWVPISDDTFTKSETTFFKDGTWLFEGVFNQNAQKNGAPPKLIVKGTYRSIGNISIETATEMSPNIMSLPDTKRFAITEITPDGHISTSLATGEGIKYKRKN